MNICWFAHPKYCNYNVLLYRNLHRMVCVLYAVRWETLTRRSMPSGRRDTISPGQTCFVALYFIVFLCFHCFDCCLEDREGSQFVTSVFLVHLDSMLSTSQERHHFHRRDVPLKLEGNITGQYYASHLWFIYSLIFIFLTLVHYQIFCII